MKRKNKILVVSHDAGGSEVISAYVKAEKKKFDFICYVAGPAKKIFQRKKIKKIVLLPNNLPQSTIRKILKKNSNVEALLLDTSWESSLEIKFLKEAKKSGIRTIAFLDHWINYRERFGYPYKAWKKNLPDEIWVGDKYAFNLAKKKFPGIKISLVPNPYFKEIRREYKQIKNTVSVKLGLFYL